MKALSILFLSVFLLSFVGESKVSSVKEVESTTVIICTGKYSKRYHNSQCRGMNACKGEAKKVSLSAAQKAGLTKCGYCYK